MMQNMGGADDLPDVDDADDVRFSFFTHEFVCLFFFVFLNMVPVYKR